MKPFISIIIPIYKAEKWLTRCIDSVINQSYEQLDIILINDGSPDKCGEICEEYKKKDKRIRVIHKKNEGPSVARNIGLDLAVGDFIQFVDSDDWLNSNACEILIDSMAKDNVNLVVCGLNITKAGNTLRTPHLRRQILSIQKNPNHFFELFKIFASPCNKLYKKDYIKNRFDTEISMGEDLLFNLDYLKNIEKVLTIENCLYNVSLDNSDSLNRKFREDRLDMFIETQKKIFTFCNSTYGNNYDKTFIYNKSILGVHAYLRDVCEIRDWKTSRNIIKKYLNNDEITEAVGNANHERKDYKLFNVLLKLKIPILIYSFFKTKFILLKLKRVSF